LFFSETIAKKIRNLTITFTSYTPDKLLKMYCGYFLFFPRLRPCAFHGPSHCADRLCFCLHACSNQLEPEGTPLSLVCISLKL